MTENGERAAWITLAGVDGVGPAYFDALVGQAGGADTVLGPRPTGCAATSCPPGGG